MTNESGNLILKRASALLPSGEWNDDDFDVFADGVVVLPLASICAHSHFDAGQNHERGGSAVGSSWLWTYGFDPLKRNPAHGYEQTREAAMAAWRRE